MTAVAFGMIFIALGLGLAVSSNRQHPRNSQRHFGL